MLATIKGKTIGKASNVLGFVNDTLSQTHVRSAVSAFGITAVIITSYVHMSCLSVSLSVALPDSEFIYTSLLCYVYVFITICLSASRSEMAFLFL